MVKSHEDASKKWVDEYWVFTFDGNCLKLTAVPLGDYVDNLDRCRSFSQDGYFYVFCEEKAFVAKDGEIIISWGNCDGFMIRIFQIKISTKVKIFRFIGYRCTH